MRSVPASSLEPRWLSKKISETPHHRTHVFIHFTRSHTYAFLFQTPPCPCKKLAFPQQTSYSERNCRSACRGHASILSSYGVRNAPSKQNTDRLFFPHRQHKNRGAADTGRCRRRSTGAENRATLSGCSCRHCAPGENGADKPCPSATFHSISKNDE